MRVWLKLSEIVAVLCLVVGLPIDQVQAEEPAAASRSRPRESFHSSPYPTIRELRFTLRPHIQGNFVHQTGYQTAYVGRIVKVVGLKVQLKVSQKEARNFSRCPMLGTIPGLHAGMLSNTGVGVENVDNEVVWIDAKDIYSIEDAN